MYNAIGKKIKFLAQFLFAVPTTIAFIIGFVLLFKNAWVISLILVVVIPLISWISSWFLYGFGEIIDKLCDIEQNTRNANSYIEETHKESEEKIDYERLNELERLRRRQLITEEEYNDAVSKENEE